jgi:hypothetical protein
VKSPDKSLCLEFTLQTKNPLSLAPPATKNSNSTIVGSLQIGKTHSNFPSFQVIK